VHYGVNKYFNDIMKQETTRAVKAPRPPKQPKVEDFQFFPPRLFELLDQEVYSCVVLSHLLLDINGGVGALTVKICCPHRSAFPHIVFCVCSRAEQSLE
jgi:hypothetical protein